MKPIRFAAALLLLFVCIRADAQTGCPGCTVNLPNLPDDTLYLAPMPDGVISFLKQQSKPTAASNSAVPPTNPTRSSSM